MDWKLAAPLAEGSEAFGVILLGPSGAESAIEVPVRLHNIVSSRETITLAPPDDTRLFSGAPTTNYGQDAFLHVGANDTSRSVLHFDLGGINPTYGIESAKLQLYVDAFGGGGSPANLAAYELTTGFAENSATWNTPWVKKGGDFAPPALTAPISMSSVGKWVEFDVTPWVQGWFEDASTNHGVLLQLVNQTSFTYYRFASGENWDAGHRPILSVTVTKP